MKEKVSNGPKDGSDNKTLSEESAQDNDMQGQNIVKDTDVETLKEKTKTSEVNGAAEEMEVDEDSNLMESKSNISAPVSVDNDSKQASIMSEDTSRDSVDSTSIKSGSDADSSNKNGFIGKVKDEEGTDILITLNDKIDGESEAEDSRGAPVEAVDKKSSTESDVTKISDNKASTEQLPSSAETNKPSPVLIQVTESNSIPPNAKVFKQGGKIGYLANVGGQKVFVPLSTTTTPTSSKPNSLLKTGKQTPQAIPFKLEDLKPKSSMDMIELMRWELYNRIPDNFNWSVAFHPKKDELSAITSFLLELGHDVVKEAVYKDIIQIQTKKKENGDLKENEIESLEKMKTVYDNTKKKVEHLFLDTKACNGCKFKTESSVILAFHKDFPHYDPPWDTSKGVMRCGRCKFSTRTGLQYVLHMESIHKCQAKFPEKEHTFNCELCPLSTSTKNKLEKHKQKCEKHFKLGSNLQPYFHDVNFCMKNMYYKPKRIASAKSASPAAPAKSPASQQATPVLPKPPPPRTPIQAGNTGPRPALNQQQNSPAVPTNRNIRPAPPVVHPPIPKLQPPPKSPFQSPTPAKFRTAAANMPNYPPKQAVPPNRGGRHTTNKEMQGFEVCELCGGYVKDRQALRIHFYYAHKVEMPQAIFARPTPPLVCDVCQAKFWTTQGLSKHKSTLRHFSSTGPTPAAFGTNQMCFMCMKKVPSLFTHVEQVHGMSMKDLVLMKKCIMCGVTANDKRSLESHLATAHGILMKATDLLGTEKAAARTQNSPQAQAQPSPQNQPSASKSGKSGNLARQNLCVFCQIQFADNIQLTMHCIKVHATCNGCGMVVASTKHLMYHSCKVMKRKCIICGLKNIAPEVYAAHVKSHVKPCNVHVDKLSDQEIDTVREKIKKEYKPHVISLDSDEDSEEAIFDKSTAPEDSQKPKKGKESSTNNHAKKEESEGEETKNKESQENEATYCQQDTTDKDESECENRSNDDGEEEEASPVGDGSEDDNPSNSKDVEKPENLQHDECKGSEVSCDLGVTSKLESNDNETELSGETNSDLNESGETRKRRLDEDELPEDSESDVKRMKLVESVQAEDEDGTDVNVNIDM